MPIAAIAGLPPAPAAAQAPVAAVQVLPAGTPVYVALDEDLSTATAAVGDRFRVVVSRDVVADGATVIAQGAAGWGEVTFVSDRGGFGRPGILGISLRSLDLGAHRIALDGRYREVGANRAGATAATFFVAGVFAGLIKGEGSGIPRGRELKARIGEDLAYGVAAQPVPQTAEAAGTGAPDGVD